jgi:hypothetical protein
LGATLENGDGAPDDEHDDHHGSDLHDPKSLVAGLVDALDVLPPEVEDGDDAEGGGKIIFVEVDGMLEVMGDFLDEASEILAGGDGADGASENVVEQQCGD